MAKEKGEKTSLYLLSIVAIVAIVGIVVLILNSAGSVSLSSDDLSGQAVSVGAKKTTSVPAGVTTHTRTANDAEACCAGYTCWC